MSKNKGLEYAVLGIAFVVCSVLTFVIPTAKTAAFWIAYGFAAAAFVGQILIWNLAFRKGEATKSKFLGWSLTQVGLVYLAAQILVLAFFMAAPTLPAWSAVTASILVLGISVICRISGGVSRGEITRVDAKVREKVFFIKARQADVELLAEAETNKEIRGALLKLAEKLRFSAPMSDPALTPPWRGR